MIEIITGKDVQDMYLETEYGTFTPIYEYEHYDQETDSYTGFKVIKTAEEVYNEWLFNKEHPSPPTPNEMEVRLGQIEDAVGILATQVAKNILLQNGGMK